MIILMNSAMMPAVGTYKISEIPAERFFDLVRNAREMRSYIGYQATADFISRHTGRRIGVNREMTVLGRYEMILVCKLKYRLQDPGAKKDLKPSDDDYEFFLVEYRR